MVINTVKEIGDMIKKIRKEKGFTQKEAAAYCGIGTRFLSELENGKPTLEIQKVLQVLKAFGLNILIKPRRQ